MRRRKRRTRWFREDLVAWLLVTLTGSAILLGSDFWLRRRVLPETRDLPNAVETPKIVVLAFDRIVRTEAPNKITQDELRRHLRGLEREGFVAVSLEAVARFYDTGKSLPERSLLLTFDHGYLSTYEAVDPILRELGWPAVLFVMTERQQRRDPFFVYWDRLTRMVASGLWEIGSHGHHGHDPVVVDAEGNEGPFFIRARWLAGAGRSETWDEFRARVRDDHNRARDILTTRLGRGVLAYAPPLRDVAGLTAAPEAHQALEEIVRSSYRLALFDDRFGVNDRRSNPRRLRRLRVEPGWSTADLVRRIDFAMGGDAEERIETIPWTDVWVTGSGDAELENGELVVTGYRRADIWRAGSQWVEDWELEGEVLTEGGELWIVQESEQGPGQWRFGGTEERIYLQTRDPGERTEVIQHFAGAMTPGRWHHFRLIKRGTGIWMELDGDVLTTPPTYLPGRWRGNVGVVHWNEEVTSVRIRELHFRPLPFEARVVSSTPTTAEIQAAIADAPRLSALSPRIFELGPDGLHTASVDTSLLRILARRFGWEIVPTVRVFAGAAPTSTDILDEALSSSSLPEFSGLRVEWSGVPVELRAPLIEMVESHAGDASWRNGRLILAESEGAR